METLNLDWIEEDEKFALIGLRVSVDPDLDHLDLPGGLSAFSRPVFVLPDDWRERLGTLRVGEIEAASLCLVARMPSQKPSIFDAENLILKERVGYWLMGLRLKGKFTAIGKPFIIQGSRTNGELELRNFSTVDPPLGGIVEDRAAIGADHLREAAQLAATLESFATRPSHADHWRLVRCLSIYLDARADNDIPNRIHQFTRCIEGLIVPETGKTRKQFMSRTELFVGPRYHDLMGELYDVRSHFEHLHEDRYLKQFDRPTRIRLAELEAVSEWIARSCLARILLNPALKGYFGNVDALNQFWTKPEAERRAIWGEPVDPCAMLDGFNFESIRDEELGARP